MAKGVVDVFNASVDPAEYLNGLEKALAQFTSTSRTSSTINDKRRGSFDCTLQTAEAERVMKLIHAIPGYDSLANFCCLTDWEKDQVFSHYRRKNNITGGDASMGTDADAKPGDESSAHPGEEEADEPANDPTDVVRDSENSGKQPTFGCVWENSSPSLRMSTCACIVVAPNMAILNVNMRRGMKSEKC